jgi:outer membrane protein OmpA-like peptidoglycan-associated protein
MGLHQEDVSMASPILDGLVTLAGPMLGRVAGQLGESPQSVSTGMKSGIAAILAGLLARAGDSGAMNQVAQAATSIDSAAVLSDPGTVLATPASATAPAGGVLAVLFGGRTGGIADAIAQASGMKSSSAASLLSMAVPLVLAFLKRQTGGTLSGGALANTLMSQRDAIMADAPAGLGSLLGLGGAGAAAAGMAGAAAGAASRAAAGARMDSAQGSARIAAASMQSSGRNWLWPVLGVVGLALIGWLVLGRSRGTQTAATADTTASSMTGALDSTGRKMGAAADSAAGAIGGAVANLGAFVKRSLPGGVELNVPENGVESHLLSFITDANRPVSDTVWFNFDRLLFETGSSNLSPTSKEQVDNIAAILKAYPAVNIKLGGYTDNVGNAAANQKLSGDRANTVKAALVERGIAAGRLAAEGYGDAHPVADNSTPEGREQNRRIAIRVTKK